MSMTNLFYIVTSLLIGYILGRERDNNKALFNRKLEVYSNIVYHINSAKHLQYDLNFSYGRLKTFMNEINNQYESKSIKKTDSCSNELKKIDKAVNLLNYKDEMIKLFAPARLIGSKLVIDELREHFSLVFEYYSTKEKNDLDALEKRISKNVMELEQLMRKDLGHFRVLSKLQIWWHLR